MSWKLPFPIFTSRTNPSNSNSESWFSLNLSNAFGFATLNVGETSTDSPVVDGSFVKAAFGALAGLPWVVDHKPPAPTCVDVQPAGRTGWDTPSNFSVNPTFACPIWMVLTA